MTFARLASSFWGLALGLSAHVALSGCTSTTDSLGYDEKKQPAEGGVTPPTGLRPLSPWPRGYPNPFRDVLMKPQSEIDAKIEGAFNQLFHGNADTQAVYFPVGANEAEIRDIYHNDVRTEGQSLGMMIAVQLGRRDEFDRLWRHAKSSLAADGANEGYYDSYCDTADGLLSVQCIDPFGMQQFAMSLIFAHGRWGSDDAIDYESDVLELLDVMRTKEERNGGVVDGVTNVFNAETALVPHEPKSSAAMFTRPSIELPAYYTLWAQATGDAFWNQAADAGRTYLKSATNATTGLMPLRAYMDGSPVTGAGWDAFRHEAYRNELNFALDQIWIGTDPWVVTEADRLIAFFFAEGIETYGKAYTLDGMELDSMRETALVVTNGTVAGIATRSERAQFIQAVWDLPTPEGPVRYYAGLMDMLALLVLGGRFQVY